MGDDIYCRKTINVKKIYRIGNFEQKIGDDCKCIV